MWMHVILVCLSMFSYTSHYIKLHDITLQSFFCWLLWMSYPEQPAEVENINITSQYRSVTHHQEAHNIPIINKCNVGLTNFLYMQYANLICPYSCVSLISFYFFFFLSVSWGLRAASHAETRTHNTHTVPEMHCTWQDKTLAVARFRKTERRHAGRDGERERNAITADHSSSFHCTPPAARKAYCFHIYHKHSQTDAAPPCAPPGAILK